MDLPGAVTSLPGLPDGFDVRPPDERDVSDVVALLSADRSPTAKPVDVEGVAANLVGLGMELDAIAAVAVGGTLLTGGRATVVGTLIGALIIQLVRYTLLANGVPDAAALVVKAAIILLAVWLQRPGGTAR